MDNLTYIQVTIEKNKYIIIYIFDTQNKYSSKKSRILSFLIIYILKSSLSFIILFNTFQ